MENSLISIIKEILSMPSTVTLASFFVAITTFFLALTTWKMARETRNSIESYYKPYVIMYLERSREHQSALYLVVENIGTAPAIDIKFKMLSFLEDEKYEKSCIANCFKKGPLFNGINFIAPGKRWDTFIEMGFNMQEDLIIGSFEVDIAFKHTSGKNSYKTYNVLNMADFTESIWLGGLQSKQVKSLESIAKSTKELNKILKTKMHTVNADDTLRWSTLALMLSDSDDKNLFKAILNSAFEPSVEQLKEIDRWAHRQRLRYSSKEVLSSDTETVHSPNDSGKSLEV